MNATTQKGFTLIELMIVVAIIGILAAIAIPAYQNYTQKARFSETELAVASVKSGIDVCYQTTGNILTDCDTYADIGTTALEAQNGANVDTVVITEATDTTPVIITGTSNAAAGASTYILTGTTNGGTINWVQTGSCDAANLC